MSQGWMGWAPYVPVAHRRLMSERLKAQLRKQGRQLAPIVIEGRTIAKTFWGKAWCSNLEAYRDYENRLARGRSCVRNGAVIDLQMAPGEVRALVCGSELYETSVSIHPLAQPAWRRLCADCAGRIDSLVELLQGRFSKVIMERLCRQDSGLFPRPSEIRFACSCPDHASMCKHVAAVLSGVGARLDEQPELLFRLRAVDGAELIAGAAADLPFAAASPATGRVLQDDDVAALFGIDLAIPPEPVGDRAAPAARPPVGDRAAPAARPAARHSPARSEAGGPARGAAAAADSRAAPAASAAKIPGVKAAPRPRPAVPPSKRPRPAKAPPQISKAVASMAEGKPEPSDSVQPKLVRDRANWPWKARAAARRAKRS